eukprot:g3359.t1
MHPSMLPPTLTLVQKRTDTLLDLIERDLGSGQTHASGILEELRGKRYRSSAGDDFMTHTLRSKVSFSSRMSDAGISTNRETDVATSCRLDEVMLAAQPELGAFKKRLDLDYDVLRHLRVLLTRQRAMAQRPLTPDKSIRKKTDTLSLFPEWSPRPAAPEVQVPISEEIAEHARASSVENASSYAKNAVDGEADSRWLSKHNPSVGGRECSATWEISLNVCKLSAVYIAWSKDLAPETVIVMVQRESKSSVDSSKSNEDVAIDADEARRWEIVAISRRVASTSTRSQRFQVSPPSTSVSKIRLLLRGFSGKNTERRFGIESVRFFRSLDTRDAFRETPQAIISSIAEWTRRTHQVAVCDLSANVQQFEYADRMRRDSLIVLEHFAIMTGSLEVSLRLAQSIIFDVESTAERCAIREFGRSVSHYAKRLRQLALILKTRTIHGALYDGSQTYANAVFDSALSSSTINIRADGREVTSTSSSNSHAVVNVRFSGTGIFAWEFKIIKDSVGDEMTCIGAALATDSPITNSNYERSNRLRPICMRPQQRTAI